MSTGHQDETRRQPWVGRASARPPVDPWPTAEQPIVPPQFAPPPQVIYIERPRRRGVLYTLGLLAAFVAGTATVALIASPALRAAIGMVDPSPTPTVSPTPSPTTPAPPPAPGLNDPVQDGKFEFVVRELSCGIEELEWTVITERPAGQYCVVDVSVTNMHDDRAIFPGAGQYVYTTDDGKVRSASDANFVANDGQLDVWFIGGGDTITVKLVFDIPADAAVSKIELHDSLLSGGTTVTVAQE